MGALCTKYLRPRGNKINKIRGNPLGVVIVLVDIGSHAAVSGRTGSEGRWRPFGRGFKYRWAILEGFVMNWFASLEL